jgi:signal transduction histidine kinase
MSLVAGLSSASRLLDRAAGLLRSWWPDALLGAAVFGFGVLTIGVWDPVGRGPEGALMAVVALGMGVSSGLFRVAPGLALGLVWVVSMFQVAARLDVAPVQLSVVLAAYGTGRYGSVVTLWASGLSIPLGAVAALGYLGLVPTDGLASPLARVLPAGGGHHPMTVLIGLAIGFVLAVALLGMPWTLGLALRLRGRAERSTQQRLAAEADRHQAEEIARLREEQTRLAHDVHDVVGHSLAVILAQAESAQFRPDSDTAAVRATLANIAASARQSLRDVREVLSSTDDTTTVPAAPTGTLDALIEGVQAAGNIVRSTVVGTPRPLPPELDVVAFRVLQEMLTNALKHGRRGEPVHVARDWHGQLRIEVLNVVASPERRTPAAAPTDDTVAIGAVAPGRGLEGMRRRLESVGGRLDLRHQHRQGATTFTATAWVPIRTGPG